MPLLRNALVLGAAAAVLIGGGLLLAQPGAEPGADAESEVTVPMQKTAKLSPAEMAQSADEQLDKLRDTLSRLVELRQVARQSKDVIKLNCVNDKLLLYKQLVNIAESAKTDMTEAIAQGDDPGRYHYYGQMVLAREKGEALRNDAEACIGEEMIFLGPTRVDVTDRPDVALDDLMGREAFSFEEPKYATPFN